MFTIYIKYIKESNISKNHQILDLERIDQCSTCQGYNDKTQFSLCLEAKLTALYLYKKFAIFTKNKKFIFSLTFS